MLPHLFLTFSFPCGPGNLYSRPRGNAFFYSLISRGPGQSFSRLLGNAFSILLFPVARTAVFPAAGQRFFLFSYFPWPRTAIAPRKPCPPDSYGPAKTMSTRTAMASGKPCPPNSYGPAKAMSPRKTMSPESFVPEKLCPGCPAASECEVQERYVRTSHNVRDAADQQQDVHCRRYVCACLSLSPGQAVQPFAELRYAAQHGENQKQQG